MSFKYEIDDSIKLCPDAYVTSITFPISRYGQHSHTITFAKPVTEKSAITSAKAYLRKPLTPSYYEKVKDDLGFENADYAAIIKDGFETRGELIESLCFVESIEHEDANNYAAITLAMGS